MLYEVITDARTERAILQHLREALKARTVLVVSHRLSAVEQAQQIVITSYSIHYTKLYDARPAR